VAVAGCAFLLWDEIKQKVEEATREKPPQQQREQAQQQEKRPGTAARDQNNANASSRGQDYSQRESTESSNRNSSPPGPGAVPMGVKWLDDRTIDAIVGHPYTLIIICDASAMDRNATNALATQFASIFERDSGFNGWGVAILDHGVEGRSSKQKPLMRLLLTKVDGCSCAVLRRGQRLTVYREHPRLGEVKEWLEALKMGEVQWQVLGQPG